MRDHEIIGLQEAYLEVCEEGRSARRRKPSKSVEQLKAEISARDEAKAQRATERAAARRPLTPGEKYDQEKATKKDKSSDFSRHRMTGSGGHGSTYSVSSRFKEEFVVNYLLDEGFASDEKSAEAILGAMSEAWVESIIEETKRTEYLQKKFNKENERKSGSALKYIPGKQNTGQALQKAKESERNMRGDK
jgi:hypothetical protein